MKPVKIPLLFAAGILALCLTACGAGQTPAAETAGGEYQSHTFDFQGSIVDVSVDLQDGWDAEFDSETAYLYDCPRYDGLDPVAFGTYESREEYEERLGKTDTYTAFAEVENGVAFTDSAGVQDYILDLGEDVHYLISVRPDCDAREIMARFDVELTKSAPQVREDSIYLTLVNRSHKLPDNWESRIELEETANYFGEPVRVEKAAYAEYQALRSALLEEGVDIELESCYRSVERQEELWAEYEEAYGLDYCNKYVAVPGFSEHHTGFAIDTNLIQQSDDQASEKEKQKERAQLWEKVHRKLPEYGFILRYLEGKEDITGYSYEPWHLRYVGDPDIAREIMKKGITLEEYLGQVEPADATVDYGTSALYTQQERKDAVSVLRTEFDTWPGCALHSVRYAGDACSTPENLEWMKSLGDGKNYAACIEFLTDFHSPAENSDALDPDAEYRDYQWWLARTFGGDWELLTCGY